MDRGLLTGQVGGLEPRVAVAVGDVEHGVALGSQVAKERVSAHALVPDVPGGAVEEEEGHAAGCTSAGESEGKAGRYGPPGLPEAPGQQQGEGDGKGGQNGEDDQGNDGQGYEGAPPTAQRGGCR
ncbi:MAG: hypothetical protein ACOY94_15865 [Bacillota bacterium]